MKLNMREIFLQRMNELKGQYNNAKTFDERQELGLRYNEAEYLFRIHDCDPYNPVLRVNNEIRQMEEEIEKGNGWLYNKKLLEAKLILTRLNKGAETM